MVNGTSPNTELTGLGKYKLYSIQIAGRTAAGLGNFSDAVVARTEQDGTLSFLSIYQDWLDRWSFADGIYQFDILIW